MTIPKARYDRIMAARDQQELIYLDQLQTARQERDEARAMARELMGLIRIYAPDPAYESGRRLLYRARQLPWMKEPE